MTGWSASGDGLYQPVRAVEGQAGVPVAYPGKMFRLGDPRTGIRQCKHIEEVAEASATLSSQSRQRECAEGGCHRERYGDDPESSGLADRWLGAGGSGGAEPEEPGEGSGDEQVGAEVQSDE
jgi:hypothetical protein